MHEYLSCLKREYVCVYACTHVCMCGLWMFILGIPGLGFAMPQPILCASASLELFLKIDVIASETSPMSPGKWAPDPRQSLSD